MARRRITTNSNGHDSSPYGGVTDPITANRLSRMVANLSSMPRELSSRGDRSGDPRRDIDDECGYPKTLTKDNYWAMYDRNPIAKRVVQVLPRECWQTFPELRESEDSHVETELEREFKALDGQLQGEDSWYESRDGKTSIFFDTCRRADEACGIGSFGVILIGLDDAKKSEGGYRGLQEPVQGFNEEHSVPVNDKKKIGTNLAATPGKWRLTVNAEETRGRKLLYLQPFDESVVTISQFENNPSSPRSGKPVMYLINTFNANASSPSSLGLPLGNIEVHWTRVVHVLDNPDNSAMFGVSRLHTPWNPLSNIQKILGADGEGCWKNGMMRTYFETHPSLGGDVEVDDDALRDMMENLENGTQKYGRLSGMTAHTVAPALADPTPHLQANVDQICIMIPVPKRVFMGTERGELASSQDDAAWNDTLRGRQNGHCTVRIAVPLIDRLIAVGVLPKPKKRYTLVWPDLESLSEDAAATVANKWADFFNKYISGGLENMMAPDDALTRLCRMSEEESFAILNRSMKWIEFNKWIKMRDEEVELKPVEEWPDEVPVGGSEDALVAVGHLQEGAAPTSGEQPPMLDEEGNPVEPEVDEDGEPVKPPAGKGNVPPQFQANAFCATGEGGGQDNSCSSSGGQPFPRPDYWDADRQPTEQEQSYWKEISAAETPRDATAVRRKWDKLADADPELISDGTMQSLHKSRVDGLKSKNATQRSAEDARADRILRTRDSTGRATGRKMN